MTNLPQLSSLAIPVFIIIEIFTLKVVLFKIAQKVGNYFGHFSSNICHQELSKIVQSGHTGAMPTKYQNNTFYISVK